MQHMDNMFEGKKALVTNGGSGTGREIAQLLNKLGAKTYVMDKSARDLENLKKEEPAIEILEADITDWDYVRKAVESILPIDLLVNNGGIGRLGSFLDSTESDIQEHLDKYYKALFNISQTVARELVKGNKPGAIVNISTASTSRHTHGSSFYGSSKAALDSLTRYMAVELGPKRIRVNSVNPTVINESTLSQDPVKAKHIISRIPLGRFCERREVADAAVFLLSDRASFINGVNMLVDGGCVL